MTRKTELEKAVDKRLQDQEEANRRRNQSCQAMFAEALDHLLEAEQELQQHLGTDTPERDRAEERRNRLRKAILNAYNVFVPVEKV